MCQYLQGMMYFCLVLWWKMYLNWFCGILFLWVNLEAKTNYIFS